LSASRDCFFIEVVKLLAIETENESIAKPTAMSKIFLWD
jgi:hypothetical protein